MLSVSKSDVKLNKAYISYEDVYHLNRTHSHEVCKIIVYLRTTVTGTVASANDCPVLLSSRMHVYIPSCNRSTKPVK